jgi:hypothetical protein
VKKRFIAVMQVALSSSALSPKITLLHHCGVTSCMTNLHEVAEPVRRFAELVLRIFPEWADRLECPGMGDAIGDCSFCIVPPEHPAHRLYVVTRHGSAVEVRYDDGVPPGPAEAYFVQLDEDPAEVAEAVGEFVQDIIAGRVIVVRERIPFWVRWLRRNDCDSLVSFQSGENVSRSRPGKVVATYSWTATG